MAANPLALFYAIEKLAPTVIELITEVVEAVSGSKTKRDAARKMGTIAARRILLG
jgi:hypothetical protein